MPPGRAQVYYLGTNSPYVTGRWLGPWNQTCDEEHQRNRQHHDPQQERGGAAGEDVVGSPAAARDELESDRRSGNAERGAELAQAVEDGGSCARFGRAEL